MEEVWAVATNTHSLLLYVCFDQCTSICGVAVYVFVLFWVRTTSFMIQCCFRPDWVQVWFRIWWYLEVVLLNISLKETWSTSLSQTYLEFTSVTLLYLLLLKCSDLCFQDFAVVHHDTIDLLICWQATGWKLVLTRFQCSRPIWNLNQLCLSLLAVFSLHHG